MSIKLVQSMVPGARLQLEQDRMGHAYELVDYWEHHPRYTATLRYMGREQPVEFTFAPRSFLDYIAGGDKPKGEKFGAYIGNMVFINSDLQRTNPKWIPYIVTKLWADRLINPGLDTTGRVQHWQSLFGTIRLAGMNLSQPELTEFLSAIGDHDTSGYFALDKEVRSFLASAHGDSLEARRKYLEHHRMNHWVIRGREEEMLAGMGFRNDGFRNHAEAITKSIVDLGPNYAYSAAPFVRELRDVDHGTPILITPPYNKIAYMMTLEGNGIVDLIRFQPMGRNPTPEEIITVVQGKYRTLDAVSKRISYIMHRAEEKVQEYIATQHQYLDGLVIEAEDTARQLKKQIADIAATMNPDEPDVGQSLVTITEFPTAQHKIKIRRIHALASQADEAISGLEALAEQIRSRI